MPQVTQDDFAAGARIAARSEIRDIRAFSLEAELKGFLMEDKLLRYELDSQLEPEGEIDENVLVAKGTYRVEIFQDDANGEAEPASQPLASISCVIAALYEINAAIEGAPYTAAERESFAYSTGQFAIYPYARQAIADLTIRLGLPPLTLPILQLGLDGDPASILARTAADATSVRTDI